MTSYLFTLGLALPVLVLIGLGALFRQLQWLKSDADSSLMKLVLNLFYPCLIFSNIVGNEALQAPSTLFSALFLGFFTISLGFAIGYYFPGWRNAHPNQRRTFAFTVGVFNYGYIPIPLAMALFAAPTTGVLLVFNVGVEIAFWTVGLMVLTGISRSGNNWKRLISPPLITILIAVPCNFLGMGAFLLDLVAFREIDEPNAIHVAGYALQTVLWTAGQCAIPLGLILIGASILDLWRSTDWWKGVSIPIKAVLIRLAILPVLFLLLARFLPLSQELREVLILQAAMPAAVFPIVLARIFGGDMKISLQVVLSTSLVSLFLIPIWIGLGRWFVFQW